MRLVASILATGFLSACAMTPIPTGPSPGGSASSTSDTESRGEGATLESTRAPASQATQALLTRSQSERNAGDLGGAAATIERALSISPDDALLWVELAEIRMAQGDAGLAEEMARKALTLTNQDSMIAARARRLIPR